MNQSNNLVKNWMWAEHSLFIQVECFAADQAPSGQLVTSVQFSIAIKFVQCLTQAIIT